MFQTILRAAVLVSVLGGAAVSAQTGSTYTDADLGFSVKTVKGWEQVPPEPTEKQTVARWAAPRDIRDFPCRMFIHVFDRKGETTGSTTKIDLGNGEEIEIPIAAGGGGGGQDFRKWAEWYRRELKLPKKGKRWKIKTPKDMTFEAERFEVTYDSGYTLGGKPLGNFYSLIGIARTARREYVVELYCGEISKRKFKGTFNKILDSFTFSEAANAKKEKAAATSSQRERARARARKEATKVKGWWFVETENYIVVTNVPKKRKSIITDLSKRMEAIRERCEKDIPPVRPIEAVSIVRVCKDRDTYLAYGAPGGSAGYWYAAAEELVVYAEGEKNKTRSTLHHEAFHQYIYYAMGEVSPCICLNEGGAEYYGGSDISGSRVKRIEKNKDSVNPIREAIRRKKYIPLKDILQWSQPKFYAQSSLCYPQGWSIYYFLSKGLEKGHPWEQILPTYWETIRTEVKKLEEGEAAWKVDQIRKKAFAAAFGKVDWEEFEKDWINFTMNDTRAKK